MYDQQSEHAQCVLDVLCLVKESAGSQADAMRFIVYQKDNEEFSAWEAVHAKTNTAPLPTPPIRSAFNPHLFARHATNLASLMPIDSFPGFSSPSWYVKTPGSFFCLHVEQLYAPFYNLCYEGSTTWWVVRREDRARLDTYVVRRAREHYGVSDDEELTEQEAGAMQGLLYTKQVLIHPEDLARAGVRVSEIKQVAGTVVMGDGNVVHFGTTTVAPHEQSIGRNVNEAVNVLPVQWLTTGLPRLLAWMRWMQQVWMPMQSTRRMQGAGKKRLRAAMRDPFTNELLVQHCSPHWCHEYLLRLQSLLTSTSLTPDTAHSATRAAVDHWLSDSDVRERVLADIADVLSMIQDSRVKPWLLKHAKLTDGKPETDYWYCLQRRTSQ